MLAEDKITSVDNAPIKTQGAEHMEANDDDSNGEDGTSISTLPCPTFSGRNRWNPGGIQVAGRNWSESGWIPTSFRVKIKEIFKLRFLSVPGHSRSFRVESE